MWSNKLLFSNGLLVEQAWMAMVKALRSSGGFIRPSRTVFLNNSCRLTALTLRNGKLELLEDLSSAAEPFCCEEGLRCGTDCRASGICEDNMAIVAQ